MVLTRPVGEFRLQKKVGTRYYSRAISGGQALTYSSFEVMPPLVGRVDAPKSHPQCKLRERRSSVLFPGGAVKEIGKG
jgi:hypothetical protein